jgi:hypothetical protein
MKIPTEKNGVQLLLNLGKNPRNIFTV